MLVVAYLYSLRDDPTRDVYVWMSFFALITIVAIRLWQSVEPSQTRRFPLLTVPFLMLVIWYVIGDVFGEFNPNAIAYHLRFGLAGGGISNQQRDTTVLVFLVAFALLLVWSMVIRRWRVAARFDAWTFLPLIVLSPMSWSVADALGYSVYRSPQLVEQYHPVHLQKVEHHLPNIMHIYLESAERTFLENGYFEDVIDPLLEMENRGFSATNIKQVANTDWTIAGMVSSSCGVPLIAPWLASKNHYTGGTEFMPAAECLPKLLQEVGYSTHFIKGGELQFAGTASFLKQHGFQNRIGMHSLLPKYREHMAGWGVSDGGVLEEAEQLYRSLLSRTEPFYQVILTVGGHAPNGILAKPCLEGSVKLLAKLEIVRGVECANKLVHSLLARLEDEGLLENTIVIIQSDHLSMGSDATPILKGFSRKNFFMAFGPGIESRTTDRQGSMFDVYPTILELIGLPAENDRAGLGVSLLSDKPNLIEAWGEDTLSRSIKSDVELRRYLWGLPMTPTDEYALTGD